MARHLVIIGSEWDIAPYWEKVQALQDVGRAWVRFSTAKQLLRLDPYRVPDILT